MSITSQQIEAFSQNLCAEERSPGTIENYLRHVRTFAAWLGRGEVTKEVAAGWKAYLVTAGYSPCYHQRHAWQSKPFLCF